MTSIGGISLKMLTVSLRQLKRDGFVQRVHFPVVFTRVKYTITPFSKSLMDALNQPVKWANENMAFNLTVRKKSAENAKT